MIAWLQSLSMATFLLKTEPEDYAYDDLERDRTTTWNGIANAAALKALRSSRKGDEAFIYHTGDERAIVGLARIVTNPYEDPEHPGRTSDGAPKHPVIDLKPLRRATSPVTLAAIKADARFKDFALVRQSRLSAMPVPDELAAVIRQMAGL
ncbi:MAG: EVE domain-containing protein [Phycisphaeraceae bacterium]|nr:EVE domain-containing protein [Phycisphaeraceae bacterium]